MQKCEKKSDAEAWNKVFYESNVNTLFDLNKQMFI